MVWKFNFLYSRIVFFCLFTGECINQEGLFTRFGIMGSLKETFLVLDGFILIMVGKFNILKSRIPFIC